MFVVNDDVRLSIKVSFSEQPRGKKGLSATRAAHNCCTVISVRKPKASHIILLLRRIIPSLKHVEHLLCGAPTRNMD